MSGWFALLFVFAGAYLIGSISFAVLVARQHGVDIFQAGSGNPGATNVKRVLGSKAGNIVFIADFLKAAVPVWLAVWLFPGTASGVAATLGAILGHSFSIYLKFRGGKAVASTMGAMLALMPLVFSVAVACWLVLYYATRFVSVASIGFALTLPVAAIVFHYLQGSPSLPETCLTVVIGILIVWRHRSNLARLRGGYEHGFSQKGGKS